MVLSNIARRCRVLEIRLTNITKSYGEKKVINDVSLTIESGSFTTLLGPSGCGKTTLLRMIAGLETPDTGEIYFKDKCIFSAILQSVIHISYQADSSSVLHLPEQLSLSRNVFCLMNRCQLWTLCFARKCVRN